LRARVSCGSDSRNRPSTIKVLGRGSTLPRISRRGRDSARFPACAKPKRLRFGEGRLWGAPFATD
jgi:hypothetical protein